MSVDALAVPRAAEPTTFVVAMSRPETHLFEIEMSVAPFARRVASFDLVLPVWTPGSYAIRDFARHVRDLSAADDAGAALAVAKVEKSRWRVSLPAPAAGPFRVRYRVYANELSVRTSHLDASHASGNGASLFFYVDGRKEEPQALRFVLPAGWRVSIALPERGGAYVASDYDELVDSPFECGTHRVLEFTAAGRPHAVAIWGTGNEDTARLVKDLAKLVEAAAAVFGGAAPYERYLFIVHLAEGARGGLEHRASQVIGLSPWRFRPEKSYRDVLLLFSHELFHAWNVKRIRPSALGPFDYTREVHTRDLWAMEGLTSYYEALVLVRAGLLEPKHAFEAWTKELKAHRDAPGAAVESAEQASFDAWIRFYRPDENSVNVSESYYRRGALIGLALDLTIREATRNARSLDDVLRHLWVTYAQKGVGYPEGGFEAAVRDATGLPAAEVRAFFDRHVRGVETPPFERLATAAGLLLSEKPVKDDDERETENGPEKNSGAPRPDEPGKPAVKTKADFGWKTKKEDARLVVAEVFAGRAAYEAGISAGDELVALDGVKADEEQLKRIERDAPPGTTVRVSLFRRARLLELAVPLGGRRDFTYRLAEDPKAPASARSLYAAWLGRPFPEPKADGRSDPKEAATPRPEKLE